MQIEIQLNAKQKSLHERAVYLGQQHASLEFARVDNLIAIEASGVHLAFGKKMFVYATEILGMEASVAYAYISVARACAKFPLLRKALSEGALTVSKAARLVSVLSSENADELVDFARSHPKREIEDEIVRRNPRAGTRDRLRPLSGECDELKVRLKKSVSKDLKRAQTLNPSLDLSGVLEEVLAFYLQRKDPVRKAERAQRREQQRQLPAKTEGGDEHPAASDAGQLRADFVPGRKRKPLTAAETHAVHGRDRGQCTFVAPDGKRCQGDRWTEIHHIVPVQFGGSNELENLTTLCSFHHDLVHQLSLPTEGQLTWLR
jgi:hypothetical protein